MSAAGLVERAGEAAHRTAPQLPAAQAAARDSIRVPGQEHQSLLDRFLEWLAGILSRFVPGVHVGGGPSALVGWLVLLALAVGLVLAVVRTVARVRGRERTATERPNVASPPAARDFEGARREALALAAGDPQRALRILYAAVLSEVARRGGWAASPGRTNWGYVRRMGRDSPGGAALAECTTLFERVVYGHAPAAADDVRRLDALAGRVLA